MPASFFTGVLCIQAVDKRFAICDNILQREQFYRVES